MTKISNRYKIFRRYEEDPWGKFLFRKKKRIIIKRFYLRKARHLNRINPRYLDITNKAPFKRKRLFKNLHGKSEMMIKRFTKYFVDMSENQLVRIFYNSRKGRVAYKRNFALLIESRVDSILMRINVSLFKDKHVIREWVFARRVFVDCVPVLSCGHNMRIQGILSFNKESIFLLRKTFSADHFRIDLLADKWSKALAGFRKEKKPIFLPKYLDLNYNLFIFCMWRAPTWGEIPYLTNFTVPHIMGKNKVR